MLQYLSAPLDALVPVSASKIVNSYRDGGDSNDESTSSLKAELEDNQSRQLLQRIKNPLLRAIVVDMTQKDPERRLSASEYLNVLQGNVENISEQTFGDLKDFKVDYFLPSYFDSCVYPLFLKLHWNGVTPDDRITIICEVSNTILSVYIRVVYISFSRPTII
jgi:hypothetical protein